jgi:hypothetical protein
MSNLDEQIRRTLSELQTLRDQVRLDLHLAGMEAKKRWNEDLEPRVFQAEVLAKEVSETTRDALHDTLASLRTFRAAMKKPS